MKFKQYIRNWLGIKDPVKPKEPKDWSPDFGRLEKEHWKIHQVLKERTTSKCPVCKRVIHLWPFEDCSYYVKSGAAYHVECYKKDEIVTITVGESQ